MWLLIATMLVASVAVTMANAPAPAPSPAPFNPVVTVKGEFEPSAGKTVGVVLGSNCFGSNDLLPSGTISVFLKRVHVTPWTGYQLAVFTHEAWMATPLSLLSAAALAPVLPTASYIINVTSTAQEPKYDFPPIQVVDVNFTRTWVVVLVGPSQLHHLTYTVVFNQTTGTAKQEASCPHAPAEGHSDHASNVSVAIICSFGAIIWLVIVFFTIKYTCSQQYFVFANFVATLPGQAGQTDALTAGDVYGDGEEEEGPSAAAHARRTMRFDPKRKEREAIKNAVNDLDALTSCKAMPPVFANLIGAFIVVVVTIIYLSVLLATLDVPNWKSWIGAGILLVVIAGLVGWCVFRYKFGSGEGSAVDLSDLAVEELKHQFEYAMQKAKEEIADERQEALGHAHH